MHHGKIIKTELLNLLEDFHIFCEINNLKYCLAGGTMLGAIRHQGFIPWDDDIDVCMPRDDYKKLLKLFNQSPHKNSVLKDRIYDSKYVYPFAKLVSTKVIVQEDFYIPNTTGVWIDIFPLDELPKSSILKKIIFFLCSLLKNLYILRFGTFKKRENLLLNILLISLHKTLLVIPSIFFYRSLHEICILHSSKHQNHEKLNLINYFGAYGVKDLAPKNMFQNREIYRFEGKNFYGTKDYDLYMTNVYGDYMKIPPINKRISHNPKIIKVNL